MSAAAVEAGDLVVGLGDRRVIDGVSLRVERGEFLCLCGPNGGGKTTFLKTVLGLIRPEAGRIAVFGEPPARSRSRVGYLPQRKAFARGFPATAADLIVAGARGTWPLRISAAERERARAALQRVGGEPLLDRALAGLSGGETQRVFLARALVNDPALLLLDEPTAGVDRQGRAEFLEVLFSVARRGEVTAVLVTHSLLAVRRLADRVVYLDQRILAVGPPEALLGEHGVLSGGLSRDHALHEGSLGDRAVCEEE